jgi:tRNA(Leu) C34 or U34 (ribose-2'-O)-methylase TrmL
MRVHCFVRLGSIRRFRNSRNYAASAPRSRRQTCKENELQSTLQWESFDFGSNPKFDKRFEDDDTDDIITTDDTLEEAWRIEADRDAQLSRRLQAWQALDPLVVEKAIGILQPFVTPDRYQKMTHILQQRTAHARFLFECPSNPSNAFACLRTIESFGIQHVDVVLESSRGDSNSKTVLSKKRGMRAAMGAAQWLTLRNHASVGEAVATIRQQQPSVRVFASDVNPNARDIREIDWDAHDGPICIVMGNEELGISSEMRALADETFYLPMFGFAESFNLSVATAITLAHLSAASSDGKGPLRPGDLPEHEYNCLVLKGRSA